MKLVDFHCHLDLYQNYKEMFEECEKNKIFTLAVTTTPRAWPKNLELSQNKQFIEVALGLHPQLVNKDFERELNIFKEYLPQAKYIGEIGLDAGKSFIDTLPTQIRVFSQILELCSSTGSKVLSVHSIKSTKLVLDLIEKILPPSRGKVVLHWFTGTSSEAKRAVKLGCYFSLNTAMLKTKKGINLLDVVPLNKILTETDGPFIKNNGKPMTSLDTTNTINYLAKITRKTPQFISQIIYKNLYTII